MNNRKTNDRSAVCARMVKTARATSIFIKVVRILLYVVTALLTVTVLAFPANTVLPSNATINLSGIEFTSDITVGTLILFFFAYIIPAIAISIAGLFIAENIFKDVVANSTPFTERNPRRIKALSFIYLAVKLVPPCILGVAAAIAKLGHVNIDLELGVPALVWLVLWTIALMFDYGALLQRQDNETV